LSHRITIDTEKEICGCMGRPSAARNSNAGDMPVYYHYARK